MIFQNNEDYVSRKEAQQMIDRAIEKAMRQHNRNASIISASIGTVLLIFYAHGVWMVTR